MCLTKEEKIINFKDRMLSKLIDKSHSNWKKKQKYQYLYLRYVIEKKEEKLYWYSDECGFDTSKDDARLEYLSNWLLKIYKKYNLSNEDLTKAIDKKYAKTIT